MKRYIDAEKLKAEIERLKDKYPSWQLKLAMDDLKEFISSLQQEQPEADLEKEIKRFLSNATKMNKGEWRGKYPISDIGFRAVARHFFELGLNARKENENESRNKIQYW